MELSELCTVESHEEGAECNILSPIDGSPTDVFINIQGGDSRGWRAAAKKQTKALTDARADGKKDEFDYEASEIEKLVDTTLGWRGIVVDGKEFPFTQDNARKLYTESPSVVSQLQMFVQARANFTKG